LEAILRISRNDIEAAFRSINLERFEKENTQCEIDEADFLFSIVTDNSSSKPVFHQTCWFHLTRIFDDNTFEQGILPLGERIDSIWEFLHRLTRDHISTEEWDKFRLELCDRSQVRDRHGAYLYNTKVPNPALWGPFAFLVRDVAFRTDEVGSHDCLRVPEIVEDICKCYSGTYSFDLLEAYRKQTKPCIVKFIHNEAGKIT
jgi:hypothetical protein